MPYFAGAGITILANDPSGCGFGARTIAVVGVKPKAPPSQPGPANLVALNVWDDPAGFNAGDPFTVHFTAWNAGGVASGAFIAHMDLDQGAQGADVNVPSMAPGEYRDVFWSFPSGLPAGDHYITIFLDYTNVVVESSKLDNSTSIGLVLYN
jgi:hypothetical protein